MLTLSFNNCDSNKKCDQLNKFVAEVNDLLAHVTSEEVVSLEDAEVHVSKTFRSLAQMFLEVCVSEQAGEKVSEPVSCPECATPCSALRLQKKDFSTLCGKISICRWMYQCEQGHRHAPWDVKQQLLDKYTRRVAEMMCRLVMQLDFREAADELSRQGIEVSHTMLHEKVGEWSADLSVPEQVDTQTLRDNERWSVSCDGCRTNSPDGWKETKVGCVYRDYPQLGSGAAPSARTESIRYVAERENAEQFGFKLFALATQSGIYRDAIDTQEIVFIWDGAAWIWNLAAEHFPNAVGQRCKQAAMKWEQPGINAVLKWWCLFKNNAWDNYWYQNAKAA